MITNKTQKKIDTRGYVMYNIKTVTELLGNTGPNAPVGVFYIDTMIEIYSRRKNHEQFYG